MYNNHSPDGAFSLGYHIPVAAQIGSGSHQAELLTFVSRLPDWQQLLPHAHVQAQFIVMTELESMD
jgi:hypothetical protein